MGLPQGDIVQSQALGRMKPTPVCLERDRGRQRSVRFFRERLLQPQARGVGTVEANISNSRFGEGSGPRGKPRGKRDGCIGPSRLKQGAVQRPTIPSTPRTRIREGEQVAPIRDE